MRGAMARLLAVTAVLLLVAAPAVSAPAVSAPADRGTVHRADDVTVLLNGAPLTFDVTPHIVDGRLLVPFRSIFEALGSRVGWDEASQTVTATHGEIRLQLVIGRPEITVGAKTLTTDAAPRIIDGRTLVPLRVVSETLGTLVGWNGETRTVTITTPPAPAPEAPTGGAVVLHDSPTAPPGSMHSSALFVRFWGVPDGIYALRLVGEGEQRYLLVYVQGSPGVWEKTVGAGFNIPGRFRGFEVHAQATDSVALSGEIPAGPMIHIRHLLADDPLGGPGYAVVLRDLARSALTHAEIAAAAHSLAVVREYADNVYGLLTGAPTGMVAGNLHPAPGADPSGLGIIGYAAAVRDHARLAAGATGAASAMETIRWHAAGVAAAVANIIGDGDGGWAAEAAARARAVITSDYPERDGANQARAEAAALVTLVRRMLEGAGATGGVYAAYRAVQDMMSINLTVPGDGS